MCLCTFHPVNFVLKLQFCKRTKELCLDYLCPVVSAYVGCICVSQQTFCVFSVPVPFFFRLLLQIHRLTILKEKAACHLPECFSLKLSSSRQLHFRWAGLTLSCNKTEGCGQTMQLLQIAVHCLWVEFRRKVENEGFWEMKSTWLSPYNFPLWSENKGKAWARWLNNPHILNSEGKTSGQKNST